MPPVAGTFVPPPLPLLITGITGVTGYNALDYFRARYPGLVFGIRQLDSTAIEGPGIVPCDLEDRAGLAHVLDRHRIAAVLDCAGNCALKACELDPDLARRCNVEGAQSLVEQTAARGIRLVHLSVDLVFSGLRDGGYTEDDPTDPVTMYGKTMAAAEAIIAAADPAACTLRISLPMGWSLNGHAGAIDWIGSRFKKSRPATLYTDEVRTPTYTDCLNELCDTVLASSLAGLYHAGGPRRLSLYQIAQIINRVGGFDPDLLYGLPRRQAGPIPPRAGNVSMDSAKLQRALGYNPFDPWPLDESLVPTHPRWHYERRRGETGSLEHIHRCLATNPARRRRESA
jgi:dTDP-4-dehydrorhamnose reductase